MSLKELKWELLYANLRDKKWKRGKAKRQGNKLEFPGKDITKVMNM
jgi:hypothetical protein